MRHFTVELEELNQKLLEMGGLVESAIHRSVRSLVEQNRDLAEQVIRDEPRINRMEMEIDDLATRLLALHQPMARDLRFLTSALKINNDLERIGDLAHAHRRAGAFADAPSAGAADDRHSQDGVAGAVHAAASAWTPSSNRDASPGAQRAAGSTTKWTACATRSTRSCWRSCSAIPGVVPAAVDLIFVARNLERIGDHATNIAEDVVFLVKGIDVRHHAEQAEKV